MTTKDKKAPKEKYEMTIEKELFDAWNLRRSTSDVKELMAITGKSVVTIHRALTYGHIKNKNLIDTISNFYIKRAEKQKELARKITGDDN